MGSRDQLMDSRLKGHSYVNSGIDMACWGILGQATERFIFEIGGGRYGAGNTVRRLQAAPNEPEE